MTRSETEALLAELEANFRATRDIFIPREVGAATLAMLKAGKSVSIDTLRAEFEARLAEMISAGTSKQNLARVEAEEVIAALESLQPT